MTPVVRLKGAVRNCLQKIGKTAKQMGMRLDCDLDAVCDQICAEIDAGKFSEQGLKYPIMSMEGIDDFKLKLLSILEEFVETVLDTCKHVPIDVRALTHRIANSIKTKQVSEAVDSFGLPIDSCGSSTIVTEDSKKIRAWRAVDDIMLSDADPYYPGDGVLGPGTYLRPHISGVDKARSWRDKNTDYEGVIYDAKEWYVVTEYELSFKNLAVINDENTDQLWSDDFIGKTGNPLFKGKFSGFDLSNTAKKKGFDGVLVTGADVDGGHQVLIPLGKKPPSKTISHHLVVRSRHLADLISKKVSAYKKIKGGHLFIVKPSQAEAVDRILAKQVSEAVDAFGLPSLHEKALGIEVPYAKEKYAEVYEHPSAKEMAFCLRSGDCRAFLDGGRLIVWPPLDSIHHNVREQLHLGRDAIPLYLYGHQGRVVSVTVTDDSRDTKWHHNPAVVEEILNHSELSRFFDDANIEIGFYDEAIVGNWLELEEADRGD